jgi:hypothetical protein
MNIELLDQSGKFLIALITQHTFSYPPVYVFWQSRLFVRQEESRYREAFFYRINSTGGSGVPV